MADVTYNFKVESIDSSEQTAEEEAQQQGKPNSRNPASPKSVAKTSVATVVAIDAAKQIATKVSGNIGKWTGNSLLQQQINLASKLAGYGARLLVDPTPFKAASIVSIGIETGFDIGNYYFDLKWEKKESERAMARTGLGSFRNI